MVNGFAKALNAVRRRLRAIVLRTRPRIECVPFVATWPPNSMYDGMLRGRVTSAAPLVSLRVHDRRRELAAVRFPNAVPRRGAHGEAGADAVVTGFQLMFPLPRAGEITSADLWLSVRTLDGATVRERLRLARTTDAIVLASPRIGAIDATAVPTAEHLVHLDDAEISAGGQLNIRGWAVAMAAVRHVTITIDGREVGTATHGDRRDDVAAAYPGYTGARTSGFALRADLPSAGVVGRHAVAQVVCDGGAIYRTAIPIFADTLRPSRLLCDHATVTASGVLLVEGWAWSPHGIERIWLEADGSYIGDVQRRQTRLDVAAAFAWIPTDAGFAFHGDFELAIGSRPGQQPLIRVCMLTFDGQATAAAPILRYADSALVRLEVDAPGTLGGVVVEPVARSMTIIGWAYSTDGISSVTVSVDGALVGPARHGLPRPDVANVHPEWKNSANCGFLLHRPLRAVSPGRHAIEVVAHSRSGRSEKRTLHVTVDHAEVADSAPGVRRTLSPGERATMAAVLAALHCEPHFHLIVFCGAVIDDHACRLTIESLLAQSWNAWTATIVARSTKAANGIQQSIERCSSSSAGRWRVADLSIPGVADQPLANWSEADLAVFMLPGDELAEDALAHFALAAGLHPAAAVLYADEMRTPSGQRIPEPFYKPDFSPMLLLSMNYIGRPLVMRTAHLAAMGATAGSLIRRGLYDLTLQAAGSGPVEHVRELLSCTGNGESTEDEDRTAVALALGRLGIDAAISAGLVPDTWRADPSPRVLSRVSIIIPTSGAHDHIGVCLDSLRATTRYHNYEIICVDNIPDERNAWRPVVRDRCDKIVRMQAPFNWSRFNNAAARIADGDFLLFLNDDVEIVEPGWLEAMLAEAAHPGVGVVGARLLYPDGTVQHGGMFLGVNNVGRHAFRHSDGDDPGYFGLSLTRREVIAVTGACMLTARSLFEQLGGFDEAHDIINNDLDYCLRAHRAGWTAVYTPFAKLIHHEGASRGALGEAYDRASFSARWRSLFARGDPYFNPRLSGHTDDYRIDSEGVRAEFAGYPPIDRTTVQRILVVKLDHIGDFITALPAVRKLKSIFAGARITVLASRSMRALAGNEPAIDDFIEFQFFHDRSELGERDVTIAELEALTALLAPRRFDLAIDLRKHRSTRPILRRTGARILAGYDHFGEFPWLDISLEFGGDHALLRKRNHISVDLLNLVAAIDVACTPLPQSIEAPPLPIPAARIPECARHLYARPVVAVHPGSGNLTKQWPEAHFSALIELLIVRNNVSVLLVGGDDEAAIAGRIADDVGRPGHVASVAGLVPLQLLPNLLASCALYIGNDSGPKHIAAAGGLPTIGIHSGVVSPVEWAPMGTKSVALYRDMTCAPCYLARAEDCPRDLACIRLLEPALVHQMAEAFLARPVESGLYRC